MKAKPLGLLTSTVTSYDQTKTTLQGRVGQRTITDGNGAKTVLGPQPVVTADVQDDTGAPPTGLHCSTQNGRVFIPKGFVAGVLTVSYYTLTTTAGVTTSTWVGDLKFAFTNTGVYTLRGMQVDDTSSSAMNFAFIVTNTTAIQGGLYEDFGVNITDFVKVSVQTHPVATLASTNKVVYQIGDTATQAAQTVTTADGGDIDPIGGFVYILSGAAATPKIFKFVNTVPTAAPVAGYSIANGTIVITAVLPALSGVLLLVNCVKLGTPGSWSANSGSLCLHFLSTTTIYHAKVSDITNGAVSLPSLNSGNMAGSGDFLTPTAAFGQYSQNLDKYMIMNTTGQVIVKQGINNDVNSKIWGLNSFIKTEIGGTVTPSDFGAVTNLCLTDANGFAVMVNTSVGQRNFLALDLTSDETSVQNASAANPGQINASIISPVITVNLLSGVLMGVYSELAKRTVRPTIQYRISGFATGPGAGFDATWTSAPRDGDLSGLTNATQVQFRFLFTMMGQETTNPTQINEAYFIYNDIFSSDDNLEFVFGQSTSSTPGAVAYKLKSVYATNPNQYNFNGYADDGTFTSLVGLNSTTNTSSFAYSTNGGTSYTTFLTANPSAANVLGAIIKVTITSPPGATIRSTLRTS